MKKAKTRERKPPMRKMLYLSNSLANHKGTVGCSILLSSKVIKTISSSRCSNNIRQILSKHRLFSMLPCKSNSLNNN